MGDQKQRTSSASTNGSDDVSSSPSSASSTSPSRIHRPLSLVPPPQKKKHKSKATRAFRTVFRSFPIIAPACKFTPLTSGISERGSSTYRVTGTLFGYRKGRVSLSMQESPNCLPSVVIELCTQTHVLQKEMSTGLVRIALECEKRTEKDDTNLLDEPLWTMFSNGKKLGYAVKKEASEEDLSVMEILKAVSMGAGVIPGNSDGEAPDGEMAYIRAVFERVIGSKDSETLYMLSPEGNSGPELSIFFVRV